MEIITKSGLVDDTFLLLDDETPVPDEGDIIVSLERFLESVEEFTSRGGQLGVLVSPEADPYVLSEVVDALDLIAIRFPRFADGRGYSQARILRDNLKFDGTLRAVGNVLHDQLFYYHRCGFTEFALDEGENVDYSLKTGFDTFSVAYQPASDDREAIMTPGNEVL